MKKQLEVAIIKANSATFQDCELYWLLSRTQLEFVLKELEIFSSSPFVATAKYEEAMLPVINLEKYYGLAEKEDKGPSKYYIIRSVNEKKELVKLIVETPESPKIQKLETDFTSFPSLLLPQNSANVLGMYSLQAGKIAVVPDFIGMTQSLHWRENKEL